MNDTSFDPYQTPHDPAAALSAGEGNLAPGRYGSYGNPRWNRPSGIMVLAVICIIGGIAGLGNSTLGLAGLGMQSKIGGGFTIPPPSPGQVKQRKMFNTQRKLQQAATDWIPFTATA
ncbi:MAG: hypothetical protein AAFN70_17095, partial [Planctomycetota bacterium]